MTLLKGKSRAELSRVRVSRRVIHRNVRLGAPLFAVSQLLQCRGGDGVCIIALRTGPVRERTGTCLTATAKRPHRAATPSSGSVRRRKVGAGRVPERV